MQAKNEGREKRSREERDEDQDGQHQNSKTKSHFLNNLRLISQEADDTQRVLQPYKESYKEVFDESLKSNEKNKAVKIDFDSI